MRPNPSVTIAAAALLLAACSTTPPAGGGQPKPDAVQWKEVTRIVGGNFVTYRVPVTQEVNDNVNMRSFDTSAQATPPGGHAAAATSAPQKAAAAPQKAAMAAPAGNASAPAPVMPDNTEPIQTPTGVIVAPIFHPRPQTSDDNRVAANAATPGTSSANISQDAETALGQAEIAVRDAQSRFETAQAVLKRARDAARDGDSASVIKFARSAVSLAQPVH